MPSRPSLRFFVLYFFVLYFVKGATLVCCASTQKQNKRNHRDHGESTNPQPQGSTIGRSYAPGFLPPKSFTYLP